MPFLSLTTVLDLKSALFEFMAEREEELKSLLMKVKAENENVGLKLNIKRTKIMTFGPITSWQTNGETMETVRVFNFLGLQNHY